ncbi:YL1 nuclear protein-domain-containing protein [Aspergillus karnatakaensis]|uniref:putative signal transducer n=1 Tax=Aspergillus karnatakaensis TaxID=1810916 RepID=UPI003CCCB942
MSTDDERFSSDDEPPVESLIHGREKRSTAGRQMSALLDAEADDELALLFEEVDDDNEFAVEGAEEGGEEDDMGLDSSSDDDDDQGPNAQAGDLEGERQIEKEEKEEKKKKRAREDLRYRITSKKVKIDPTAPSAAVPTTPAPRPRKKSERVSWIPTPDEGPTRSSSRRQTMQNKELTHARLKDSEEKRIRLIATMEEAAKRKAKHKPKEMTQAEHLAEAERVEKHNSKSLNRWEEMEKKKAEERRAKIEALQNRRLDGPVISYWSGVATWADGRLARVGKVNIAPKPDKEDAARKKSKKAEKDGKNETQQKPSVPGVEMGSSQTAPPSTQSENPTELASSTTGPKDDQVLIPNQAPEPGAPTTGPAVDAEVGNEQTSAIDETTKPRSSSGPSDTAAEVQALAPAPVPAAAPSALPEPVPAASTDKADKDETQNTQANEQPAKAANEKPSEGRTDAPADHDPTSQPTEAQATKDSKPADPETLPDAEVGSSHVAQEPVTDPSPKTQSTLETDAIQSAPVIVPPPIDQQPERPGNAQTPTTMEQRPDIHVDEPVVTPEDTPQPANPPSVVEHTGRCLTVLENFDDRTAQSRDFSIYFNAKKPPRLTKISSSLCVITSLPSRYRDPDTSLPFANSYAYHEIRHTAAQKYQWSSMLGCYIGPTGVAARGVPERFLDPNAKPPSPKKNAVEVESKAPVKEGEAAKPVENSNPRSVPAPAPAPLAAPTATPAVAVSPPPPVAVAAPAPITAGAGDAMDVDT